MYIKDFTILFYFSMSYKYKYCKLMKINLCEREKFIMIHS